MPLLVFGQQPDGVKGAAAGAVVESGGAGAGVRSVAVIARVVSRGFMRLIVALMLGVLVAETPIAAGYPGAGPYAPDGHHP